MGLDLEQVAHEMGVGVERHEGGPPGWYSHERRVISVARDLSPWDYRCVLAHELGHAYYGDTFCGGVYGRRQERRADVWAARLLIDEVELETALQWHGGDLRALAYDLAVTPYLLDVYLSLRGTQQQNQSEIFLISPPRPSAAGYINGNLCPFREN